MNVRLKQSYCIFTTLLLLIAEFSSGKMGIDDDFIILDGILVRKSDEINTRSEQQKNKEKANVKYTLEKEEARLYNESKEITKHLPSECQGLQMNNLMICKLYDLSRSETSQY